MQLFKIRDGEEGRVIPYRLKPMGMGVDEVGDPISTCVVEWEVNRPPQAKEREKPKPKRVKTDANLQLAIQDVGGLPADVDALRAAFYKRHGGTVKTANQAWNRAIKEMGVVVTEDGRYDYEV